MTAILVCAAFLWATPALAHAMLEQAYPAAGSTVTRPAEIRLRFTKEITEASTVRITGPGGRAESAKPSFTPYLVRIPLKAGIAGSYRVEWHAISADGHETEGSYTFTVK